ncbi:helix-turn-helix transcriptional regulator [Actinosynnema sp. NPDC050436]|uniref:helix-turn-helix domain-containing protein n=1 Tax=Actinosynnema sp. NPDC050436 TaxID=3155659 RepID=UPI0033DEDFB5
MRTASGLSTHATGEAVGMSGSKISRIETSEIGVYLDDLEKLLDLYGVTKKERVHLPDLARHADQRGLLRTTNHNLPDDWQTWADFEHEATGLFNYEPLVIPGLLQTAEYARELIRATGHNLSADQVDALVTSRIARQGLLSRSDPLRFHVIIDQGALERPFGRAGARARQLRHIADTAELDNVTVQLLPETGLHAGLSGPFVILQYDNDPSLVLLENKVSSLFLDEPEQIEVFEATWHALRTAALDPGESIRLLRRLA